MPANTAPIFPLTPYAVNASLAAVTACTTRGPTATAGLAAANISILVPADSTNGRRIDQIVIQGISTSFTAPTAAQTVTIWLHDGTTAYPYDEIIISPVTPSTTEKPFRTEKDYSNLVLPAAFALYMSTSITTTASTTALGVQAVGGDY